MRWIAVPQEASDCAVRNTSTTFGAKPKKPLRHQPRAVPIVLGTIVLSSGVGSGETIFNAVFFIVVVSVLVQGTTLDWVAERLGLVDPRPAVVQPPLEVDALGRSSSSSSTSPATTRSRAPPCASSACRVALTAVVARGGDTIAPRGSTVIEPGDRLFVLAPRDKRADLEDAFSRWRRRV